MRMVNRSDGVVSTVLVNGRIAFDDGRCSAALGKELGFGTFLSAGEMNAKENGEAKDAARAA
jgi:hypothetical protein